MTKVLKVEYAGKDQTSETKIYSYADVVTISGTDIPVETESMEFHFDDFTAEAGENGFFIIPNAHKILAPGTHTNRNTAQTFFRERPDCETTFRDANMPIFAVNHGKKAILAVVTGMSFDYVLIAGVKNGRYYLYPRFDLNGELPYEDIEIRLFELEGDNADYSGIARCYRQYQLARGACIPLRERAEKYPVLKETAQGPMVRLRMSWKPVPPPVLEQTEENEPPVHVAITFERAEKIIEEFHRQGIKHAEFNLVGWNKSGHDGRFPDLFPVEPLLGGEEGLKRLITKARSYGYLISAHTNVSDSYTIAKRWNQEDMRLDQSGEIVKGGTWGGGQSYYVCPEAAYKNYTMKDMDDLIRLGFRGTHYFDIMTMFLPEACYNPEHPLNRRTSGSWIGKSLSYAREKIGASSSEGSSDFCIGDLDYVLYSIFNREEVLPEICDGCIPFWHIVYHGIVIYNTFTDSVNAMIKDDKSLSLNNYEYGGRPVAYFYAKFLSEGDNWMGNEDMVCATDEQLTHGVAAIKAEYDRYRTVSYLQYEFIDKHETLSEKVTATSYSNGEIMVVNRSGNAFVFHGQEVPANSFAVIVNNRSQNRFL